MASLVGNAINASCAGLIKTDDNAIIGATEKRVTDGLGNATNMTIGTGGTSFDSGTVDFTGATVSGLPSAAGLESGTGTDSMQSAASLTTVAADASGACSIAIGNNAVTVPGSASCGRNIAIGNNVCAGARFVTVIGDGNTSTSDGSILIGRLHTTSSDRGISIGYEGCHVGLGQDMINIGTLTCTSADQAVAIGRGSSATAACAVALGPVTAAKANTVSAQELELQTAGGGIYLTTPDGTAQPKLTVNNSSELLIGGNPVGGGAAGLESGTGTDSMQSAASLTTTAADAAGANSIALGNGASAGAGSDDSIAIGCGVAATLYGPRTVFIGKSISGSAFNEENIGIGNSISFSGRIGIGIGKNIANVADRSVAIGCSACATGVCAVAIGNTATARSSNSVSIGCGAVVTSAAGSDGAIAIGKQACAGHCKAVVIGGGSVALSPGGSIAIGFAGVCSSHDRGLAIGESAKTLAGGTDGIAIGTGTCISADWGIAIGRNASSTAACAIALGPVTAAKANTVSVEELETQTAGGGITMKSPNGTEYKLTVSDAGALVIT